MSGASTRTAVLLKRVDLRPRIDPLTGEASPDPHGGMSAADRCALELALRTGEEVLAITAGPAAADEILREALAFGVTRAIRVDLSATASSEQVAGALAPLLLDHHRIWAGDHSLDRGSGSVPAFVAARLGLAQALGLAAVELLPDGDLVGHRRLDRGVREVLHIDRPAVLSVEAGVVAPRRPSLGAVLAAAAAVIQVHAASVIAPVRGVVAPYRPRARTLPGPDTTLSARERVLTLSGALERRDLPRVLRCDAESAADELLAFLQSRGFR